MNFLGDSIQTPTRKYEYPPATTHLTCARLQTYTMSAGSLAVILQPAFLSFVIAVTYLLFLFDLNNCLLIFVPMFSTRYAIVAVSFFLLARCLISFK